MRQGQYCMCRCRQSLFSIAAHSPDTHSPTFRHAPTPKPRPMIYCVQICTVCFLCVYVCWCLLCVCVVVCECVDSLGVHGARWRPAFLLRPAFLWGSSTLYRDTHIQHKNII